MKKYLFLFFLILAMEDAFGQSKPTQNANVKSEGQKEIDAAMKEAQKAIDELDPETKKMMDSMGIKIPDMKQVKKNVAGISDKQLADAWEDETRIVPKRNESRIAAISQKVNDATLADYFAAIQRKITEQLPADVKTTGDMVINFIQSNAKNSSESGNMANVIWIAGKPTLALFIMGKICADDPRNTDNLNNYAAMLTMHNA